MDIRPSKSERIVSCARTRDATNCTAQTHIRAAAERIIRWGWRCCGCAAVVLLYYVYSTANVFECVITNERLSLRIDLYSTAEQ